MTKFHINAKGVPAPCRAAKGNCPYGGASGVENHYDSMEEAQVAADKQLKEKYGVLPSAVTNIEVSKDAAEYVLYDDFNEHGYQNVGPSYYDLRDSGADGKEILDNLPDEIYNKYGEDFVLVQKDNVKSMVDSHFLNYVDDSSYHDEIYDALSKSNKDKYIENGEIKDGVKEEISSFITKEMNKDIELQINGTPVYVWDIGPNQRKWGQEYINSLD